MLFGYIRLLSGELKKDNMEKNKYVSIAIKKIDE